MTDAGDSSIRNTASSGASSACATRILIGVTWLTTTTVRPACAAQHPVERGEHPLLDGPERLAARRAPVQRAQPRLEVGLVALGHLGEGQPVPGAELHLGEARLLLDRAARAPRPRISADSRVRRTGEATTASIRSASGASQSAVARICAAALVAEPGVVAAEAAGEPLGRRCAR